MSPASSSPPYAFVTLITTDQYLPGALVVASALRDLHRYSEELDSRNFHIVCLVTPETVNVQSLKLLRRYFDVVIGVEIIKADTEDALALLGRPDLNTVLTKLHIFRLTSYRKIIYLDADVLPLRPLSHLFHGASSFAAVPDIGWPDIFNSGVLVFSPGKEDFEEIMKLVNSEGSWDGGDQGVLNEWRGNDWERLSFTYNTTPTAAYTYAPAYKRFGSEIKIIHFTGPDKPWSHIPFRAPPTDIGFSVLDPHMSYSYPTLLGLWFTVYNKSYRSDLPVFTSTGALMPTGTFKENIYENAWDTNMSNSQHVDLMGLDELKHLALEGLGQTPTRQEGEGVYMTLPLGGRIDLMAPPHSLLLRQPPETTAVFPNFEEVQMTVNAVPQSLAMLRLPTPAADSEDANLSASQANPLSVVKSTLSSAPQLDPWTAVYTNTWDLIPEIQRKYASHRSSWSIGGQGSTGSNQVQVGGDAESAYRSWGNRVESTSRDGDDEAENEDAER